RRLLGLTREGRRRLGAVRQRDGEPGRRLVDRLQLLILASLVRQALSETGVEKGDGQVARVAAFVGGARIRREPERLALRAAGLEHGKGPRIGPVETLVAFLLRA